MIRSTLSEHSDRTLNLIASLVARAPVEVVLTSRIPEPFVVACKTRVLFLHTTCGLGDLYVAAALLRFRKQLRESGEERASAETCRRWLKETEAHLRERFPGVARLLTAGPEWERLPDVVWKRVTFRSLDIETSSMRAVTAITAPREGLDLVDGGDDLCDLLRLLDSDCTSTSPVPGIADLLWTSVPVRLLPGSRFKGREAFHSRLERLDKRIQSLIDCLTKKSLGQRVEVETRPALHGTRLEPHRLHHAYVSSMGPGFSLPAFRRRRKQTRRRFQPEERLWVIGFDAASFRCSDALGRQIGHHVLMIWAEAAHRLVIPTIFVGFLDVMIAREWYIHLPVVLKRVDEPFDDPFWRKLEQILNASPTGQRGCHSGIQMRTLLDALQDNLRKGETRCATVFYFSSRVLPAPFDTPEVQREIARDLGETYRSVRQKVSAKVFNPLGFLPERVWAQLPPGSPFENFHTLT